MRSAFVVACTVLVLAGTAGAQSIGIFFDVEGADCDATSYPYIPTTFYVLAVLGGPSINGITGAQFRVDGISTSWNTIVTPSPAASLTIGNPLTDGCDIVFPSCQTSPNRHVLLFKITYVFFSPHTNVYLVVRRHTNPCCHRLAPTHVLCDAPIYTEIWVPGGAAIVNGPPCTVAVEPSSWSRVKAVYGGAR